MSEEKAEEEKPRLESWDDFSGEYLKTDLIDEFPVSLAVLNVDAISQEGKPRLYIETEYHDKKWKINLNKTNQDIIREKGIKSPKELIGKVLVFDKTKVRNPSTNSMVDSFIISDIKDGN